MPQPSPADGFQVTLERLSAVNKFTSVYRSVPSSSNPNDEKIAPFLKCDRRNKIYDGGTVIKFFADNTHFDREANNYIRVKKRAEHGNKWFSAFDICELITKRNGKNKEDIKREIIKQNNDSREIQPVTGWLFSNPNANQMTSLSDKVLCIADGGDSLEDKIKGRSIAPKEVESLMHGIINCVENMSDYGYVHGDISARHVLIKKKQFTTHKILAVKFVDLSTLQDIKNLYDYTHEIKDYLAQVVEQAPELIAFHELNRNEKDKQKQTDEIEEQIMEAHFRNIKSIMFELDSLSKQDAEHERAEWCLGALLQKNYKLPLKLFQAYREKRVERMPRGYEEVIKFIRVAIKDEVKALVESINDEAVIEPMIKVDQYHRRLLEDMCFETNLYKTGFVLARLLCFGGLEVVKRDPGWKKCLSIVANAIQILPHRRVTNIDDVKKEKSCEKTIDKLKKQIEEMQHGTADADKQASELEQKFKSVNEELNTLLIRLDDDRKSSKSKVDTLTMQISTLNQQLKESLEEKNDLQTNYMKFLRGTENVDKESTRLIEEFKQKEELLKSTIAGLRTTNQDLLSEINTLSIELKSLDDQQINLKQKYNTLVHDYAKKKEEDDIVIKRINETLKQQQKKHLETLQTLNDEKNKADEKIRGLMITNETLEGQLESIKSERDHDVKNNSHQQEIKSLQSQLDEKQRINKELQKQQGEDKEKLQTLNNEKLRTDKEIQLLNNTNIQLKNELVLAQRIKNERDHDDKNINHQQEIEHLQVQLNEIKMINDSLNQQQQKNSSEKSKTDEENENLKEQISQYNHLFQNLKNENLANNAQIESLFKNINEKNVQLRSDLDTCEKERAALLRNVPGKKKADWLLPTTAPATKDTPSVSIRKDEFKSWWKDILLTCANLYYNQEMKQDTLDDIRRELRKAYNSITQEEDRISIKNLDGILYIIELGQKPEELLRSREKKMAKFLETKLKNKTSENVFRILLDWTKNGFSH